MRRVAITGVGVVSPIGSGRENFLQALKRGQAGLGAITSFDPWEFEIKTAGQVKECPSFSDELENQSARVDPKIAFGLRAAQEALDDAGIARFRRDTLLHIGVSLEIFNLSGLRYASDAPEQSLREFIRSGNIRRPLDTLTDLLIRRYGTPGRSLTNVSACVAGAQALGHAFNGVGSGLYETALAGGCDSMLNPLALGGFQRLGALAISQQPEPLLCRPFDSGRGGLVLGEGAAMLVLEPWEKARAEGKTVYAEICGYGASLDAFSLSAPDSRGQGAVSAMTGALSSAAMRPEEIGHISTHGTGTLLNDPVEALAVRSVFPNWQDIPAASIKAMTGHLIAAAGPLEALACVLSLRHEFVPPNISLKKIGAGCELNHVTGQALSYSCATALSNSFGFGGQNAALIFRKAN
ncbi:MAG: beta-ketoacyl-[acyl-carrier-protein] synthase family protein [Desulfarculales bacterium]|jgi:3-oxoacyl-[acyl-carrier-protein] synthase II|nr:beta-ketoacyl-[acyl-carrier-protein] synthase family protein [Desulfarculales bacterium]